jgi:hypothetical protein
MKNLLISQKLHNALAGKEQKPESMNDEDWEELDLEARAAIILYEILFGRYEHV